MTFDDAVSEEIDFWTKRAKEHERSGDASGAAQAYAVARAMEALRQRIAHPPATLAQQVRTEVDEARNALVAVVTVLDIASDDPCELTADDVELGLAGMARTRAALDRLMNATQEVGQ